MANALGFEGRYTEGSMAHPIIAWNDDLSRTWPEVKDRVKDAIGRL